MNEQLKDGDIISVGCDDQIIASRVKVAKSFLSRSVGLLGTRRLPASHGLLLAPCGSVHMIGMIYSLDVLFLDKAWKVVAMKKSLKPFGLALGGKHACMTLEMPAQTLCTTSLRVGDQIEYEMAPNSAV